MELVETSHPSISTKLSTLADQAKNVGSSEPIPGAKAQKKGPGRPKLTDAEKAEAQKAKAQKAQKAESSSPQSNPLSSIPTSTIIKPFVNVISALGEEYAKHPKARMTEEELEAGAQSLGLVIDKWMPDAMNKWGPEIMCVLVFGQWGMRVVAIKKVVEADLKAQKMKEEPKIKEEEKKDTVPLYTMEEIKSDPKMVI